MTHRQAFRIGATVSVIAMLTTPAAVVGAAPVPVHTAIVNTRVTAAIVDSTCTVRLASPDRSSLWAPPLDRIVRLRVSARPLRDALDALATVAKLELSYSAEVLPADRQVCLQLDRVPVGAVLEYLLAGTTLHSVVLGTSQIVLAPLRSSVPGAVATSRVTRQASVLDRVVVTGSPDGAPQRSSPYALDVIDGATLARQGVGTLAEALDLAVPGVWTWAASAGTLSARYGSIRGASSFGVSAPKIYLDGIEVANPSLVTQIDPSRVERVEVIRGPQGAALYGADAISGVVNILTRHDGTPTGAPAWQLSSSAGVSNTAYAPRDPFVQDHALSLRSGGSSKNFGLGLNAGTVGAYVPGASERRLLADASARVVRANAVFTGTARFGTQRANASNSLVLGSLITPRALVPLRPRDSTAIALFAGDSATGQTLSQYTVGGTLAVMPNLRWTHTVIAGVDGYRLSGVSAASQPSPVANTSLLGEAVGEADRGTLRLRSVGRFDIADSALLALTFAAEQATTRDVSSNVAAPPVNRGGALAPAFSAAPPLRISQRWINNLGLSAQAVLSWRERWYASAGARAERTSGATATVQQALLPMIGAAYVREYGVAVLKLRSAFGTGIRPASTLARETSWMGRGGSVSPASLEPESQSGVEAGADVHFGRGISLHVTRFDQEASGLIQPVGSMSVASGPGGRPVRSLVYTLQNVGAIRNRGWELQASARVRALQLAGAWSLVDSRVTNTATAYRGELRVGDRMLDVPASTTSLSASWTAGRLGMSTTVSRAADWIGYDRTAIGAALADNSRDADVGGPLLRRYWLSYGGVTRWRAMATYAWRGNVSLLAGGENLLNVQRGAPDNGTVTAGRTLNVGLRTTF